MILKAKELRSIGKTYSEINKSLHLNVPKSTLSYWFKSVHLTGAQKQRIAELVKKKIVESQKKAIIANKMIRKKMLETLDHNNMDLSKSIDDQITAKIALSMLCLGEATKYSSGSGFSLGSSNYKIIYIFISLLKQCYDFDPKKIRCTVQCRADQDVNNLKKYWRSITNVPERQFYKTQIDPRTIGKPTKKTDYMGVLKVNYLDTKIQLDLESLASMIYNHALNRAHGAIG